MKNDQMKNSGYKRVEYAVRLPNDKVSLKILPSAVFQLSWNVFKNN